MSHVTSLRCRECSRDYPIEPINACEYCFGPLEVSYDYDAIARDVLGGLVVPAKGILPLGFPVYAPDLEGYGFDPERARRAAEAFAELAQTNQVLVFTCHPETVKLFTDLDPAAQVITM